MKIMYMITTLGHGRGGHFYDLNVISNAMKKDNDVLIINIGLNNSPIIDELDIKTYNIYFNGLNIYKVIQELLIIWEKEKPSHIHSFDIQSLSIGKIISFLKKAPIIFSKCGGPNPNGYYPNCNNIIVMSYENLEFFKKNKNYSNSEIVYLPNRSSSFKSNQDSIEKIKDMAGGHQIFIRISRITQHYRGTFIQTIDLAKKLETKGIKIKFFIIGVIQSKELYSELLERITTNNIIILTDDEYTLNASKIIEAADFIIGTGRGIMEAASKNKILLTPMKNATYPVLINKDNFEELYQTNFSPRNKLNNYNENQNINDIQELIINNNKKVKHEEFIKSIYKKEFDIETIVPDYIEFYRNSKYSFSFSCLSYLRSLISTIKKVYLANKRGIND